jgi:hypothetical protein
MTTGNSATPFSNRTLSSVCLSKDLSVPLQFTFFLHLPKTAGTTFKLACHRALGPRLCWWVHRLPLPGPPSDILHVTDLQPIVPEMGVRFDMCGGHVQYSMLPAEIRNQALLISLIREPVSRALSFFAYLWDQPQHPLAQKTRGMTLFEALQVPAFRWAVQNQQCRHLFGGLRHRDQILEGSSVKYLIGKTDHLASFLSTLEQSGGPRLVIESDENRSRPDYRQIVGAQPRYEEALDLLRHLNTEDLEFFHSFPQWLMSAALRNRHPSVSSDEAAAGQSAAGE